MEVGSMKLITSIEFTLCEWATHIDGWKRDRQKEGERSQLADNTLQYACINKFL